MNAKTRILQQLTDEAQAVAKTTTIDLDAFLACDGDERARRWRQFDRRAKWQLVARMIERLGRDWSEAEIDHWIAKYDARWEVATPDTDLTIPPAAEIMDLAAERAHIAHHHDDIAGATQLDRVRMNIHNGARLTWHYGDLLIQSVNHPGQVYSVSRRGCTCPNGAAGRSTCWHVALYDLLLDLLDERATDADYAADRAAALPEQIGQVVATAAARSLGRRLALARACHPVAGQGVR